MKPNRSTQIRLHDIPEAHFRNPAYEQYVCETWEGGNPLVLTFAEFVRLEQSR